MRIYEYKKFKSCQITSFDRSNFHSKMTIYHFHDGRSSVIHTDSNGMYKLTELDHNGHEIHWIDGDEEGWNVYDWKGRILHHKEINMTKKHSFEYWNYYDDARGTVVYHDSKGVHTRHHMKK